METVACFYFLGLPSAQFDVSPLTLPITQTFSGNGRYVHDLYTFFIILMANGGLFCLSSFITHMWATLAITALPRIGVVPAFPILFPEKIHMPISQIQPTPTMPVPTTLLATHLVTPLVSWAQSLWFDIWPHAHTDTLQSALLANTKILLVSNAAVHPNKPECALGLYGQMQKCGAVKDMFLVQPLICILG